MYSRLSIVVQRGPADQSSILRCMDPPPSAHRPRRDNRHRLHPAARHNSGGGGWRVDRAVVCTTHGGCDGTNAGSFFRIEKKNNFYYFISSLFFYTGCVCILVVRVHYIHIIACVCV